MLNGVILAGGRGSRMGPLAAQISKALVSIGQRPHLIHQIELLRSNGVDDIVVVTSPDTDRQITDLLLRAEVVAYTVVQQVPGGPVDALAYGLGEVTHKDAPTLVLMSDTYLDADTEFPNDGDWYGVNPAPATRSFCYWDEGNEQYYDGMCTEGHTHVTIGAYRFNDTRAAYLAAVECNYDRTGQEVGMAPFLTTYAQYCTPDHVMFPSWMDVGDVMAVARARRRKFISREHHDLSLNEYGLITKRGKGEDFRRQALWMYSVSNDGRLCTLVPRVYDWSAEHYTMDFIDLPTLSELWLYWPGRPDTWHDILKSIVDRLEEQLWSPLMKLPITPLAVLREKQMFVDKARSRLNAIGGVWQKELDPLLASAYDIFDGAPFVDAHGDLNFNNILFSLNSGTFKLVDPRGDTTLPLSYELCKLRYSWWGFSEITHNLDLKPRRAERSAMDEVIDDYIPRRKSTAGMACLFIAGAPLHPPAQRERMLLRAQKMLEDSL